MLDMLAHMQTLCDRLLCNLQASIQAMDVSLVALQSLQFTAVALDLYEHVITPHVMQADQVQPLPPETPKMLPMVHAVWGFLRTSLQVC